MPNRRFHSPETGPDENHCPPSLFEKTGGLALRLGLRGDSSGKFMKILDSGEFSR